MRRGRSCGFRGCASPALKRIRFKDPMLNQDYVWLETFGRKASAQSWGGGTHHGTPRQ